MMLPPRSALHADIQSDRARSCEQTTPVLLGRESGMGDLVRCAAEGKLSAHVHDVRAEPTN
jgi:hypothetical protein